MECGRCGQKLTERNMWKRITTRVFSGLPGSSNWVKETINYQRLYTCDYCQKKVWLDSWPKFINDPDVLT